MQSFAVAMLFTGRRQSSYQSLGIVDEIDRARAHEYALLATLLSRSLDAELISRLALLGGDPSPIR